MLASALWWLGIVASVVLLGAGILLVVFGVRRLRSRPAPEPSPPAEPAPAAPSPLYPRYDPANPHYRDGWQFVQGQWTQVQVWDAASQQWYVHGVDATGAPTATAVGVTAAPAASAPKKRTAGIAMLTVGVLLAVAAIPLGVTSAGPLLTSTAAAGGLPTEIVSESADFRYTAPVDIAEDEELSFRFRVDPETYDEESYLKRSTAMVAAYYDSDFSQLADYYLRSSSIDHSVTLSPSPPKFRDADADPLFGEDERRSWAPMDTLYVVQYLDPDGKEFDKPIVTMARVRPTTEVPATPQVQYTAAADGFLELTWTPVAGAVEYVPLLATTDPDLGYTQYEALGTVDGSATAWSTRDVETEDCWFAGIGDSVQNCALRGAYLALENGEAIGYGLMAIGEDGTRSFIDRFDGGMLNAMLPGEVALERPAGTTTVYTGAPDSFPTTARTLTVGATQGDVPLVFDRAERVGATGYIHARVPGTAAAVSLGWDHVDGTWDAFVEGVRARLEAALPRPTGIFESSYQELATPASDAPVSREAPDVDFPLPDEFGEIGEYVAANLIAGNERIDMDAVANPFAPGELVEAVISQTPYAMVRTYSLRQVEERLVLEVDYPLPVEEMRRVQEETRAKAQAVVAEVVRDGMGERDIALALNDWITAHAEYDYVAFDAVQADRSRWYAPEYAPAWRADGILLGGSGVCAGYALAYKLLSDEAGIDSVYVVGNANATGHAWNKTFMDGKWQVVDPTWNDAPTPNELFGISDEVALTQWSHELSSTRWTIPSMVGQYAAG